MRTFKQFLYEAPRKPKEVPWPDADHSSGFSKLRDMQDHLSVDSSRFRLQLFVPKRADPKRIEQLKRDRDWRAIKKEFPDEVQIKEETQPVLTSFKESPVDGDNKPSSAFWTSSAILKSNGTYTSDWYQFVQDEFPHWQTDYGYLFKVKSSALVIDTMYLDSFYEWAESYGKTTKEVSQHMRDYGPTVWMRSNFPWIALSKHFDGVHHSSGYNRGDEFTYGWDVESTAWFNTGVLEYVGAVRLYDGPDDE